MSKTHVFFARASVPYFLTNEKWYYRDENGELYLTADAPPEAVESYKEFFKEPEFDKDGYMTLV